MTTETGSEWLNGLMFCYNMAEWSAMDDCAEAPGAAPAAWAADQSDTDALMRYYNG